MKSAACAIALAIVCASASAHAQQAPRPVKRAKSPALVAGGVGIILFGVASGTAGAITSLFAAGCNDCFNPSQGTMLGLAGALDLIALGSIGGGIAMVAVGARKVETAPQTEAVGAACSITSECGFEEHCIEGRCRSLVASPELTAAPRRPTTGASAIMLGDGRGYVPAAVITDICAFLTTIPPWMVAYAADFSRFATGFQLAPMIQLAAGPALHLFEGRVGPAFISLLGWSAVAATTYLLPTIVSPNGDETSGLAAGTLVLALGGIAMTAVDAVLARPAPAREAPTPVDVTWAPMLRPMQNGAVLGVSGSF